MMQKLDTLLDGSRPPAIYRFASRRSAASILQHVEHAGWRGFYLDGRQIQDKASFLSASAQTFQAPPYFGGNWDALADVLRDLSWLPAPGYLLLYDQVANFALGAPDDWSVALSILLDTVDFWQTQRVPFAVLLRGARGRLRDLPWL